MTTRFRPLDYLTYVYILINLIYIAVGWNRVRNPLFHICIFLLLSLILYLIIRNSHRSGVILFLRQWYPLIFFSYFFEATSAVNLVIFPEYLDPIFQKLDHKIFGYQPAIVWGTKYSNFFIQELMHFAYFCYYLMIPFLAFELYFKNRERFHKFIFSLSFVFYSCYLVYMFLPVIGGRALNGAMELTTEYRFGIFSRIMSFIYIKTTHLGGAFPSSHVAIAVVVSIAALRYQKTLGLIFSFITILLSISTVYCHYHYFVDTIAGVIFGILVFYISVELRRRLVLHV